MNNTMIYCTVNGSNQLNFYMKQGNEKHFLFTQRFNSIAYKFYKNGVTLNRAMSFKHGKKLNCSIMIKVSEKIFRYLRYIEKEYDMVILEKTKRIRQEQLRYAA